VEERLELSAEGGLLVLSKVKRTWKSDRKDIISEEEIYQKVIKRKAIMRDKAFVLMLWFTGARLHEVLNLTVRDIEIGQDYIAVKIKTLKRKDHAVRINYIPIRHPFSIILMKYLYRRVRYAKYKNQNIRIFPFRKTKAEEIIKEFDPYWYPHLFRHTRATLLAMDPRIALHMHVKWFGWKDPKMSEHYFDAVGRSTKELADIFWKQYIKQNNT